MTGGVVGTPEIFEFLDAWAFQVGVPEVVSWLLEDQFGLTAEEAGDALAKWKESSMAVEDLNEELADVVAAAEAVLSLEPRLDALREHKRRLAGLKAQVSQMTDEIRAAEAALVPELEAAGGAVAFGHFTAKAKAVKWSSTCWATLFQFCRRKVNGRLGELFDEEREALTKRKERVEIAFLC